MSNPSFIVGHKFISNQGYECTVEKYGGKDKITVNIAGVFTSVFRAQHIRSGSISNPYHPSVLGKGFVGVGEAITSFKGRPTVAYRRWYWMLARCYGEGKQKCYEDVSVCQDWLNFQNFAVWYENQEGWNTKGWELDKDILVGGNKVYSPDACCLVPKALNSFVSSLGEHVKGYSWHVPANKWLTSCYFFGKQECCGYYDNESDAREAYLVAKGYQKMRILSEYINVLPAHITEAYIRNYLKEVQCE